jgi:pimeloyl-ACP methyl ester carboxylesterase
MFDADFCYELSGAPLGQAPRILVWGHGWGHNRAVFRAFCSSLPHYAHILLDFPGFGESAPPPSTWGTEDYADATAMLLRKIAADKKFLWVGHSFGGRVGIQLGARHPALLSGLCLIASAGLPRRRSFAEKIALKSKIMAFTMARRVADHIPLFAGIKHKFGSPDYRAAGVLRPVFVRIIHEDLSAAARKISCPTLIVYGENDREMPPEIGGRLNKLIPRSELIILPRLDHYSVLGDGRPIVIKRLQQFMDRL